MYKNLQFIKDFTGDFKDLGLTMTISENTFGKQKDILLKPKGD
jgi:hypothetical protein